MEYTFLSLVILSVWSLPAVITTCSLSTYYKTIYCYQDQINVIPSFPQYDGTLNQLIFYRKWIMRNWSKESFTGAPFVKQLTLKNIGLQNLSCDVFNHFRQELVILNLDNNMLAHFPACSVNNLYHLRELTLSKNFLTCIPGHSVPSSLQHLDISYNQIYTLSSAISTDVYNKNRLKTFNITGNKLHRIRQNELQQFSNLENVEMSENQLEYIHPRSFVVSGSHLLVINLSQNQLTGDVWLSLEHVQQVRNLNLSHNQIDHVDDNVISSMKNLQAFDISYNMVSEVGLAFVPQQTVRVLSFHHNTITRVTKGILPIGMRFMHSFDFDLSFNLLVSVDLTILDCLYCTFSIHHNKLNTMRLSSNRDSTFSLIDISFNALEAIPSHLPAWINFNGSHNPFSTTSVTYFLTRLPDRIIHDVILKNTTFLCKQGTIPDIWIFSNVTLDLAGNCVSSELLCHLRSNESGPYRGRVSVYLDRNGIETLQECSLNVTVLLLSLKGNHLRFLNESYILEEMSDLVDLDIAENNMAPLTVHTVTGHRKLLHLNVSLNNLQELPSIEVYPYPFNKLKMETRIINFSSCNISRGNTIRYKLDDIDELDSVVDISNNNLKHTIPLSIGSNITSNFHIFLFHLISSDNHIESIQDVISLDYYNRLYHHYRFGFDYSRNKVKSISNVLHCGSNRSYSWSPTTMFINITKNLLTEFPTCDSLGDVNCIGRVFLDFSHNFLQVLPNNETCLLEKVFMLNVSHNSFTEIMKPIANSSDLRYLVMTGNKISTITPNAFIGIPYLQELDLSFNRLTVFPESIKSLSRLQKLNLAGNLILTVPDAGSSLWPHLSVFQFHGNPLVCTCSTAWLRDHTLITDLGQCSYPYKGNSATCLATPSCNKDIMVYSSKRNIQACRTGLVLTAENQNLKWDLFHSQTVKTTPQSQANIEIFRECKLAANISSVGEDTWADLDDSDETGDLVCVTLSDQVWISNIRECYVLDPTEARSEGATEQNPVIGENHKPQTVNIGVIATLSILLFIAMCTALLLFIRNRRQTVAKQRGTAPTNLGLENPRYESSIEGETSFSSAPVHSKEDEHYYDSIHPSNTYEN